MLRFTEFVFSYGNDSAEILPQICCDSAEHLLRFYWESVDQDWHCNKNFDLSKWGGEALVLASSMVLFPTTVESYVVN